MCRWKVSGNIVWSGIHACAKAAKHAYAGVSPGIALVCFFQIILGSQSPPVGSAFQSQPCEWHLYVAVTLWMGCVNGKQRGICWGACNLAKLNQHTM